ncbi:MAG: polysaccharide export protein [Myxococcales bacterium]|nr:polysaccharide export protein [Myxococcales bacterium]
MMLGLLRASPLFSRAIFIAALAFASACGTIRSPLALPPPVASSSLAPGDVFAAQIVGEPDLPVEFTVAPDGSADIPYIGRIRVEGLEPQQLSQVIRARLIADQILIAPSVTVRVLDYKSKRVTVGGEVKSVGAFPFEVGMTLHGAVARAGGLTALARSSGVIVVRRVGSGTKSAIVDFDAISVNGIPDVMLQPGDAITVPRRTF